MSLTDLSRKPLPKGFFSKEKQNELKRVFETLSQLPDPYPVMREYIETYFLSSSVENPSKPKIMVPGKSLPNKTAPMSLYQDIYRIIKNSIISVSQKITLFNLLNKDYDLDAYLLIKILEYDDQKSIEWVEYLYEKLEKLLSDGSYIDTKDFIKIITPLEHFDLLTKHRFDFLIKSYIDKGEGEDLSYLTTRLLGTNHTKSVGLLVESYKDRLEKFDSTQINKISGVPLSLKTFPGLFGDAIIFFAEKNDSFNLKEVKELTVEGAKKIVNHDISFYFYNIFREDPKVINTLLEENDQIINDNLVKSFIRSFFTEAGIFDLESKSIPELKSFAKKHNLIIPEVENEDEIISSIAEGLSDTSDEIKAVLAFLNNFSDKALEILFKGINSQTEDLSFRNEMEDLEEQEDLSNNRVARIYFASIGKKLPELSFGQSILNFLTGGTLSEQETEDRPFV